MSGISKSFKFSTLSLAKKRKVSHRLPQFNWENVRELQKNFLGSLRGLVTKHSFHLHYVLQNFIHIKGFYRQICGLRWLRWYGHDLPLATLRVRFSPVGFLSFCVFFVILFVFFQGFFSQHFVVRVRITVWARIRKTKRKRKDNIFCLDSHIIFSTIKCVQWKYRSVLGNQALKWFQKKILRANLVLFTSAQFIVQNTWKGRKTKKWWERNYGVNRTRPNAASQRKQRCCIFYSILCCSSIWFFVEQNATDVHRCPNHFWKWL